ncbi:MAG: type II toxin-antitoxin system HipA family toxin [Clostridiales Family XIII bacterium]|jgi:serine/threonine-protein kinase HipA|nr:type II toxin-antitoxin system HipA family toxin [Clostridiales Family XIII bacterium]
MDIKKLFEIDELTVFLHGRKVGRLVLTPAGLCAFQYDADFIPDGQSISPFALPLGLDVHVAKPAPFDGGFGVFDDSLPDGWGLLLMDRYLRAQGIDPFRLTALQRLSLVGGGGRGALEYRPESDPGKNAADGGAAAAVRAEVGFDLDVFAKEAQKFLKTDDYTGRSLETIYRQGGTSGGARPKVFLRKDGREWIVKSRAAEDPGNIGKTEYEYSLLAKDCGIEMPETRLFEERYFGAERFDRTPAGKIHTISAAGLLGADYRAPSLDYTSLLLACVRITGSMAEARKLYLRMVFNVVISNRDDHAKNFAFLLTEKGWSLSPAYDLLPSRGFGGYHTTTVNGNGNPARSDLLATADKCGIPRRKAEEIIETVSKKCGDAGMSKVSL